MARPTDYGPQIVEQTKAYLLTCEDEEVEREGKNGGTVYRIRPKLPTIEGLSIHLGISRETIYQWEKLHPEFSDILDLLRAEQSQKLIVGGLSGDYNPTITKLMMSKHGYVERQDITSDGKALPQPILNAVKDDGAAN